MIGIAENTRKNMQKNIFEDNPKMGIVFSADVSCNKNQRTAENRDETSHYWPQFRDDTWNVLSMQHMTSNWKRWDYSDIPSGGTYNY